MKIKNNYFLQQVIFPLVIILGISALILLSGCNIQEKFTEEKLEKEFEKTITGVAYAPINKRFNNIERIKVKRIQKQLCVNESIIRVDKVKTRFINGKLKGVKMFTITYIPVTIEDVNKRKKNGRMVLSNKIRKNLIYNEEDL